MLRTNSVTGHSLFPLTGGVMAQRMRAFDWSSHPLGTPEEWPQSLQIAIRIMLNSRFAMWMGWGAEFFFFCNDAYAPTLGIKQDRALGARASDVWAEIWKDVGPLAESVVKTGEATWDESLLLFLERSGYPEETYHTFSYSPLPNDDGTTGGLLCVVSEETERVIGERRIALLRDLGADLAGIKDEEALCGSLHTRLRERPQDLPFALMYLLTDDGAAARLACAHHLEPGSPPAPEFLDAGDSGIWPADVVLQKGTSVLVEELDGRFNTLPAEPWNKPPRTALVLPIARQGQEHPAGFLVAGLNPYRPPDEAYLGFLELLAAQIAAGVASVRAYEAERKRAEALAEIDRAKTAFFSNVSHEFRTPLTLLLGPLEEMAGKPEGEFPAQDRLLVTMAHRNGLRLLKLVNSLLDFARIEAGRTRAHFVPTDAGAFTADVASSFRSAMEKAGLEFIVEVPREPELVWMDREMWEKIVLNLISNAFKFTLRGEVRVAVTATTDTVEMSVCDTGTGIPAEAVPHLFERFYRVEGASGRTHEGTGIGLALVHELVKLHHGTMRVESELGKGSGFFVTLPRGAGVSGESPPAMTPGSPIERTANAFVAEALRWLPESTGTEGSMEEGGLAELAGSLPGALRPLILLADDNADMRDYVARLLSSRFEVMAVPDGLAALNAATERRPDLVLSDVMMPRLDGFGLLRAMRANPALQSVPVILLSARAGEEARVEGLEAGADDYLIKPFPARELIARVTGTLTLASVRAAAIRRESELETERTEILESMNLAFVALDAAFRFEYLNAEARNRYKLAGEKYLGRTLWEAFPATIGTVLESSFRRSLTEKVPILFEHFHAPSYQWFEINAYPMTGGRLGVFFRDITERRQADAALCEAKEAAEAANSSKDRFLAVLSHELRTPLTPVLMVVSDLEGDASLPPQVREDMAMMRRNIELETKLIDDLLDLNRITSGKLVLNCGPVDLNEAVRHVCSICRPSLLERNVRLDLVEGSVGLVKADPARIQQVLWNVLNNAIKFTPEGGHIRVTTSHFDAARSEVRVHDNGIGIPAGTLPHIFDAFEQGDARVTRQFGGLGLGLAICKALMELHRGSIRAESEGPGRGSTFIIELPVDAPGGEAFPGAETDSAGTSGRIRVLLVEDHADTLRMLTRLLRAAGFEVTACSGVANAIAAFKPAEFDILVSDLGLPDGSGCDIMKHIRAAESLPGIVMSGFGMDEDILRSREAGFTRHLVKPVNVPQLIVAIRKATENPK